MVRTCPSDDVTVILNPDTPLGADVSVSVAIVDSPVANDCWATLNVTSGVAVGVAVGNGVAVGVGEGVAVGNGVGVGDGAGAFPSRNIPLAVALNCPMMTLS